MAAALEFARRFVASCHPDADAAVLGGSQARGEAAVGSDYDIVLLFAAMSSGAWRKMVLFEGRHVEVFAHDLKTLAYFFHEVDRPSAKPVLPNLIVEGIPVWSRTAATLEAARDLAREVLRLGPPPLDDAALRLRRYMITDLAVALRPGRDRQIHLAAGTALYVALADFALRAAGRWSATGKAVPKALAALDAGLPTRFETAFTASGKARRLKFRRWWTPCWRRMAAGCGRASIKGLEKGEEKSYIK